ncbi:MAG: pyroglutamyl-peptidase I, partial [Roseburia intestinalis]
MYRVLYMIDKEYPHMRGGFVHLPYLPEQTLDLPEGTPSMPAKMIAKALACGIRAIV